MRQTGRTSRIADFAINQLFETGQCIVTDHIAFEYDSLSMRNLENLITKVLDGVKYKSYGSKKGQYKIHKVEEIYVVHFRMTKNEENK